LLAWSADYPDPDNWLRVNFHSTQGMNRPRWDNARFDALVEEAARVTDQARRMELYQEADRILVAEEAVIMPLSYGRGRMLAKPWVTLPRLAPVPLRLKDVVVDRKTNEQEKYL
jgi:ABC-type oligopeptide transport system substrate-binding subunit